MNEIMEPTTCDWCDAVFDYQLGGYVGPDHVCPDCLEFEDGIQK